MIDGVLGLDDRSVRSAMVPKPDVTWRDIDEAAGFVRTRDILGILMKHETFHLDGLRGGKEYHTIPGFVLPCLIAGCAAFIQPMRSV